MNEKVGRSHKYNIASVKCLIICILSLLFAVFLYMKINGFFDYTSKYDIEWITDGEGYNSVMMIDGDVETTWGLLEKFQQGSVIRMKFKEQKEMTGISILNVTESADVPVSFYVSDDGENFKRCEYTVEMNDRETLYSFLEKLNGMYLAITYDGTEEGHWPITEISIYE